MVGGHLWVGKQRLREARIQAVDYLILLLVGACLGSVTKFSDETFGAPGYTYTIIAVCESCFVSLSTITTITPFSRTFQTVSRYHGYYLRAKVKTSKEADVLSNDSVTAESVDDDKNGQGIWLPPFVKKLLSYNILGRWQPKLLDGYKFYFTGDFQPSYKGYLHDLVIVAGGTVLQWKPISGENKAPSSTFIIYSLKLPDKCKPSKRNIIFNRRRSDAKTLATSGQGLVPTNLWILNSIAACKLQSFA